jgi:transposase
MPSKAKAKPRPKKMSQYDQEDFNAAVQAARDGLSVRAASQQFNVPRQTLHDRVRGVHGAKHGRPTVLTEEEEDMLLERVKIMAEWRYPFTMFDLQIFVKAYLDKKGVVEPRFKNNMPTHRYRYSQAFGMVPTSAVMS